MKTLIKISRVIRITWSSMWAYRMDTWLGAFLAGFRILLAFLLWGAVYNGRSEVGGYSLPMMITYALLSALFSRLQHQDGAAWQLASEVQQGVFSKYLTHPFSVNGYFLGVGLGRWTNLLLVNGAGMAVWSLAFSRWLAPLAWPQVLWLVLLLPLGGLTMLLFNQSVALLSLKFQDVTGLMVLKGSLIEFFSGSLIPLQLLPAPVVAGLRFTPFYYVVFYPANLLLGKAAEPPWLALILLLGWCAALFLFCEAWFRVSRRFYEGVGI